MNSNLQSFSNQEQQALEVFRRHFAAFTSGNLDSVLSDFGERSVVLTPDGVFEGLDKIRMVYDGLLREFGVIDHGDSPGFVIDALHVRHEAVFITWHAESLRNVFPFGTDTFICAGDRFARQSISFSPPQPRNGPAG